MMRIVIGPTGELVRASYARRGAVAVGRQIARDRLGAGRLAVRTES